jgi:hypothetical protein
MLRQPRDGFNLAPLSHTLALVVTLALGAALTGCADIHPAPNDPGTGMLEAPTDEADQFRRAEERGEEAREEGGERHR